ncbi:MAG: DUF262 domain-containing protein [Desulfobacterium sp.]|nr:DUF262 domain-containing protein [Desulfobacterium sp.]
MKFEHLVWTISEFLKKYDDKKINLSPSYQRNPIWTAKAQKQLIDTIKKNQPIPNFFLKKNGNEDFEMVDGQQRARTILGYINSNFSDLDGMRFENLNDKTKSAFLHYPLSTTIIIQLSKDESIEEFYSLVNSAGLRLNRPELKKAEFYDTLFLKLVNDIAANEDFIKLDLFSSTTVTRMNDIEFVSELVALLKFGIFEKKTKIDYLYKNDIGSEEYDSLKSRFIDIIQILCDLDALYPLNKTRYRQKNDFYSLFNFINSLIEENKKDIKLIKYYYKILIEIAPHIKPTQKECDVLKGYALNCVSQSNSENARTSRASFFNSLFLNPSNKINDTQKQILDFFKVDDHHLIKLSGTWTVDVDSLTRDKNGI